MPDYAPLQRSPQKTPRPDPVKGPGVPLRIGEPGDVYEREAAEAEAQVTRTPSRGLPQRRSGERNPAGACLRAEDREFFEPQFGHDFSKVQIFADTPAAESAKSLGARAYTVGHTIYFGADEYQPGTQMGRRLLAHELTHVVQQERSGGAVPTIQRAVELRPPGKREYSSFGRRQELIDRLNMQSSAIQYKLVGRRILYEVQDDSALTVFDKRMQEIIDQEEVIPLRLTTKEGRDRVHKAGKVNTTGPYKPIFLDTFVSGYVDLDDLLATDATSFKLSLIHILAERAAVPDYAKRLGTNFKDGEFKASHDATREKDDSAILQDILGDPTIKSAPGSGKDTSDPDDVRLILRYKSDEGYSVVRVYHHIDQDLTTGETFVETADGKRQTIEDFLASKSAAPTP